MKLIKILLCSVFLITYSITSINATELTDADTFMSTKENVEDKVDAEEANLVIESEVENSDIAPVYETTEIFTPSQINFPSLVKQDIVNADESYDDSKDSGYSSIEFEEDKNGMFLWDGVNYSSSNEEIIFDGNKVVLPQGDFLVLENGKIVSSNNAIVVTKGGKDNLIDIYDEIGGTSISLISGEAIESEYLGTYKEGDDYYVKVNSYGIIGYIELENVEIVPENLIQARTHYKNVNGEWVLFDAIDPIGSEKYQEYALGIPPEGTVEDTFYYMHNQDMYGTDQISSSKQRAVIYGENYFNKLPLRSTSNYSGQDYKNYLSYKGKSNSKYYNQTNSFIEAQEKYGVNSLLLLAMADHESAYGYSSFAVQCNNFFGRGAFDSDPNNACKSYGFTDQRSGILAQGIFLSQTYADSFDWRYAGTNVGNKSSGMNAYYATDPLWGQKIASHMYDIDKYLGGKESSKYRLVTVNKEAFVYKDSGLSQKLMYKFPDGSEKTYSIKTNYNSSTGKNYTPTFVVVDETANAYKIQIDNPVSSSNSSYMNYTEAINGFYPSYNGSKKAAIKKGYADFTSLYSNFSSNQFWISKANTTLINDVPIKNPDNSQSIIITDPTCGSLTSEQKDSNGNIIKQTYKSSDGNVTCTFTYTGASAKQRKTVSKNGFITEDNYYTYAGDSMTASTVQLFAKNGNLEKKTNYKYVNSQKQAADYYTYKNGIISASTKTLLHNNLVTSKNNQIYDSKGNLVVTDLYSYFPNSNKVKAKTTLKDFSNGSSTKNNLTYDSSGQIIRQDYYTYDLGKLKAHTYVRFENKKMTWKNNKSYDLSGNLIKDNSYRYRTNSNLESSTELFLKNKKITKKINSQFNSKGIKTSEKVYYY